MSSFQITPQNTNLDPYDSISNLLVLKAAPKIRIPQNVADTAKQRQYTLLSTTQLKHRNIRYFSPEDSVMLSPSHDDVNGWNRLSATICRNEISPGYINHQWRQPQNIVLGIFERKRVRLNDTSIRFDPEGSRLPSQTHRVVTVLSGFVIFELFRGSVDHVYVHVICNARRQHGYGTVGGGTALMDFVQAFALINGIKRLRLTPARDCFANCKACQGCFWRQKGFVNMNGVEAMEKVLV